jgi:hypothetical protein
MVERVVARSANVVVALPAIRVFGRGCLPDVEVVFRQGGLSDEDWWELSWSAYQLRRYRAGRLPDSLLRMGGALWRWHEGHHP